MILIDACCISCLTCLSSREIHTVFFPGEEFLDFLPTVFDFLRHAAVLRGDSATPEVRCSVSIAALAPAPVAPVAPVKISLDDVLEALEAEERRLEMEEDPNGFLRFSKHDIPESRRQNVKELNDTSKVLGMCLGVTSHWTKGAKISAATRWRPSTTSLLCRFAQQELPGFEFSSIQVNKDYKAAMHVDKNNLGPSYIIGLGDYSGGWLWLDDGSKLGRAKNIRSPHGTRTSQNKWFKFDGRKPHCVTPFSGRRYTLVFFTYSNPKMATALSQKDAYGSFLGTLCSWCWTISGLPVAVAQEQLYLRELGFPLPKEVCCHAASQPSMIYLPAVWRVPRARQIFENFEQEVLRRGGLGRRTQVIQVGQKKFGVMLEPSMPLRMVTATLSADEKKRDGQNVAEDAMDQDEVDNMALYAGSLRLLGSDSIQWLSLGRGIVLFVDGYAKVSDRNGGSLKGRAMRHGGLAIGAVLALVAESYHLDIYSALSYVSSQLLVAALRPDVVRALASWQDRDSTGLDWRLATSTGPGDRRICDTKHGHAAEIWCVCRASAGPAIGTFLKHRSPRLLYWQVLRRSMRALSPVPPPRASGVWLHKLHLEGVSTPEPFRGDAALSAQLTDSEQSRRACLRGLLQKAVLGQDRVRRDSRLVALNTQRT
eukprot:s983_g6.t1